MHNKKYYKRRLTASARKELQAIMFSLMLFIMLFTSIAVSFASSGPIILGTELNANGFVEYMCLGSGCEALPQFTWSDK